MHEDVVALRPKLKEILYDCAVDIKATKAALYLLDPAIRKFELVTEYGFRSAIPQNATFNHPLVDRCARGRTPFYVNSVGSDPKLSQILFEASTERLLVAPLFSRGDLVGMIDMRDKAAKQPFEQADVPKAQAVVDKIMSVFSTRNVFNQRFITLADVPDPSVAASAPTAPVPVPAEAPASAPPPSAAPLPPPRVPLSAPPLAGPAPVPQAKPPQAQAPQAQAAQTRPADLTATIRAARKAATRIVLPPSPKTLSEGDLRGVRDVLKGVLNLPGALVAALSLNARAGGVQEIVAKNALGEDASNMIAAKLQAWLTKRGESSGPMTTSVHTPFGAAGPPLTASQLQKVFTAPVNASGFKGMYLTVAFADTPERFTHELLASLLGQLQLAIEVSNHRDGLELMRSRAADHLLEPPFTSYPDLKRHSENVAARSAAFAQYLDLPAGDVETVTLTALVHDAGMRMLDYERLYRKKDVTDEELQQLREHVLIGAAMVEPLLGHEIARAVLCHHERVDGRGYPNELQGEEIPLASRIIQIVDAYLAITDPNSYQRPETHGEALNAIARGAGSQFDAELAGKFIEMMKMA